MKRLDRVRRISAVLISVLLGVLLVGACGGTAEPTAAPVVGPVANEAVLNRYYEEVWNKGNLAILDELINQEKVIGGGAVARGAGCSALPVNPMDLVTIIAGVRDAFTDIHVSVEEMVAEGDLVSVSTTFTAVFVPTGEKVTLAGQEIWQLEDGQIVGRQGTLDTGSLLAQMGVIRDAAPEPWPLALEGAEPPTDQDVEVVNAYYDVVWNRGDLAALDKLFAADFVDHNPDPGQQAGVEGLRRSIEGFALGFSNVSVKVEELDVAEGRIKATTTISAVFKPTGQEVSFKGVDLWRVVDGKIVERWGELDTVNLMQELGVLGP